MSRHVIICQRCNPNIFHSDSSPHFPLNIENTVFAPVGMLELQMEVEVVSEEEVFENRADQLIYGDGLLLVES